MSGENGKSWKIETMPLWLMKPCCMLTPSTHGLVAGLHAAVDAGVEGVGRAPGGDAGHEDGERGRRAGPGPELEGQLGQRVGRDAVLVGGVVVVEGRGLGHDLDLLGLGAEGQARIEADVGVRGSPRCSSGGRAGTRPRGPAARSCRARGSGRRTRRLPADVRFSSTPVAWFFRTISAPAMLPPCGSFTVPLMEPLKLCAEAGRGRSTTAARRKLQGTARDSFIGDSLSHCAVRPLTFSGWFFGTGTPKKR